MVRLRQAFDAKVDLLTRDRARASQRGPLSSLAVDSEARREFSERGVMTCEGVASVEARRAARHRAEHYLGHLPDVQARADEDDLPLS
jgi:hypothetical protein